MYWLENVFFLALFISFELLLCLPIFVKMFYHLWYISPSMIVKVFCLIGWLFFGLFFCLFLVIYDTKIVFVIMSMHNGCQRAKGLEVIEVKDEEKEIKIYNQLRSTMISMYKQTKDELNRVKEMSENNESYSKTLTGLTKVIKHFSKSVLSIRRDKIDEHSFKPDIEDKEYLDKFAYSVGIILEQWKIKYYSKKTGQKTGSLDLLVNIRGKQISFKAYRNHE